MSELEMIPIEKIHNHVITFGKHEHETIAHVLNEDESYALWVIGQGESGNPEFNKVAQYFKAAMECQESGDDTAVLPYPMGTTPKKTLKKLATPKKVLEQPETVETDKVVIDEGEFHHYEFLWASNVHLDHIPPFKLVDDSLLFNLALEEYAKFDKNSFIILKVSCDGAYLKKIISNKDMKKSKGNFYAEAS